MTFRANNALLTDIHTANGRGEHALINALRIVEKHLRTFDSARSELSIGFQCAPKMSFLSFCRLASAKCVPGKTDRGKNPKLL